MLGRAGEWWSSCLILSLSFSRERSARLRSPLALALQMSRRTTPLHRRDAVFQTATRLANTVDSRSGDTADTIPRGILAGEGEGGRDSQASRFDVWDVRSRWGDKIQLLAHFITMFLDSSPGIRREMMHDLCTPFSNLGHFPHFTQSEAMRVGRRY